MAGISDQFTAGCNSKIVALTVDDSVTRRVLPLSKARGVGVEYVMYSVLSHVIVMPLFYRRCCREWASVVRVLVDDDDCRY